MSSTPIIDKLSNPAFAFTIRFYATGEITVVCSIGTLQSNGIYQYVDYDLLKSGPIPPGPISAANDTYSFQFGVDPGSSDPNINPDYPDSGLLIERDDEWTHVWDDEVARVLGGQAFPFGQGPLTSVGTSNGSILPRNILKGVFSGPIGLPLKGQNSQMTILGVNRATTATLPDGTRAKYLSLWLSDEAMGYVKLTSWHDNRELEWDRATVIRWLAEGVLQKAVLKTVLKPSSLALAPARATKSKKK